MKTGNIKIIETPDKFKRVPKAIIYDEAVDVFSLGIYVKILGLGEKWELNVPGLAKVLKVSETRIKTALSILERSGYVKRIHIKGPNGRFTGYDYHIANTPFPVEERTDLVATNGPKKPAHQLPQKPAAGKTSRWKNQPLENGGDINRDNKENRDNISENRDNNSHRGGIFVPPTVDEVAAYCAERKNGIDAEEFVAFYASKGWMVGKNKMKDWKQAVITWEKSRKHSSQQTNTLTPRLRRTPAPSALNPDTYHKMFD